MAWAAALNRPEWGQWLSAVAGSPAVRPGVKLDPFGTSWRVLSTQARRWLPLIKAGSPIPGAQRRTDQTLIDLRGAGLVQTSGYALTRLGEAVLSRWQPLSDTWEYEMPLGVALLQEAVCAHDAFYGQMLAFWWDIRQRFANDDALLADREAALLLPYLNRTEVGFNPWVSLRESGGAIPLPVPWKELRSAVPIPTAVTDNALVRLQNRLDPSRRLAGRVIFCRAMNSLFLRREDPAGLTPYLDRLELPYRSER